MQLPGRGTYPLQLRLLRRAHRRQRPVRDRPVPGVRGGQALLRRDHAALPGHYRQEPGEAGRSGDRPDRPQPRPGVRPAGLDPRGLHRLGPAPAAEPGGAALCDHARQHRAHGRLSDRGTGGPRCAGGTVQPGGHRHRQAGHDPGGCGHHRGRHAHRARRTAPAGRLCHLPGQRPATQGHVPVHYRLVRLGRQNGGNARRHGRQPQGRGARAGALQGHAHRSGVRGPGPAG